MGPSDLEEYFEEQGDVPLKLTLASGDQIVMERPRDSKIFGMTLVFGVGYKENNRISERMKIVSVPNIVSVEPVRRHNGGSRRRRQ
jgi:2-hydroxychromene-2-carboxylate isomerase